MGRKTGAAAVDARDEDEHENQNQNGQRPEAHPRAQVLAVRTVALLQEILVAGLAELLHHKRRVLSCAQAEESVVVEVPDSRRPEVGSGFGELVGIGQVEAVHVGGCKERRTRVQEEGGEAEGEGYN